MSTTRVSWHSHNPAADFITAREHATVEQYMHWVVNGNYSAVLFDASLLQITYDIANGKVSSHRLAYVPCPFVVDQTLLREGTPIADVVSLYSDLSEVALRSPIRIDYAPGQAKLNHPAAHLTINSSDCRIACVAPMHVHRFVDFIFRHFYPLLWNAHSLFFAESAWRHLGGQVLNDEDRSTPHLVWDVHATGPA